MDHASTESSAKDNIFFFQGGDNLLAESDTCNDAIEKIAGKITDFSNIKNIHFLLGAGASSYAIPAMKPLVEKVTEAVSSLKDSNPAALAQFNKVKSGSGDNLELLLGTLYAQKAYNDGVKETDNTIDLLISTIENQIYKSINIDINDAKAEKALGLYKKFYQKLSLRNKDLARVNIFTTNNDLISETALDYLNVNYNNGFSGGLSRVFNPARFSYTFSRKVDSGLEKYEPLENMIYLYKLHGSISWIEDSGNSFFNIKEVNVTPGTDSANNVLIYPTPLKQNKSLGSPYADLIREFQKKLLLQHSVLFVIGYSFSDEHINNIVYQALASNSSLSIVIFGNYPNENLFKVTDRRIYKVWGSIDLGAQDEGGIPKLEKIHYFEFIVNRLIPDLDERRDSELLKEFLDQVKVLKQDAGV